jgi:hypothetical protein
VLQHHLQRAPCLGGDAERAVPLAAAQDEHGAPRVASRHEGGGLLLGGVGGGELRRAVASRREHGRQRTASGRRPAERVHRAEGIHCHHAPVLVLARDAERDEGAAAAAAAAAANAAAAAAAANAAAVRGAAPPAAAAYHLERHAREGLHAG